MTLAPIQSVNPLVDEAEKKKGETAGTKKWERSASGDQIQRNFNPNEVFRKTMYPLD